MDRTLLQISVDKVQNKNTLSFQVAFPGSYQELKVTSVCASIWTYVCACALFKECLRR